MGGRITTALVATAIWSGCTADVSEIATFPDDVGDPVTQVPPPDAPVPPQSCTSILVYPDADGDGHGDPAGATISCGIPDGFVTIGNDCDDACADCSPVSIDRCDGLDNDCDGRIDEGLTEGTFYRDRDGDGFGVGSESIRMTCGPAPEGYSAHGSDCDDEDPDVSPRSEERCNAIDDDCDALVDEGLISARGDALLIGDAQRTFREVSIAGFAGGYVATWTEPGPRVLYAVLDGTGVPTGAATRIDPSPRVTQTNPNVVVTEVDGVSFAVVVWMEDGSAIRARSVDLSTGAATEPVTLAAPASFARLPVEPVVAGGRVIALWLERREPDQTRGVILDPVLGVPFDDAAVLHVSARTDPDNYGPSAAVTADDPDSLYLGYVDRRPGDARAVGYVSRIAVTPTLTRTGETVRLEPLRDSAMRVVVAGGEDSVLALLGRGTAPDEQTDVFRIDRSSTRSLRATFSGPAEGLVLAVSRAPGGADTLFADATSSSRRMLALGMCATDGAHSATGAVATLLAPWAAMGRRGTDGVAIFAGRVSPTDIDPGVWVRRYGCE